MMSSATNRPERCGQARTRLARRAVVAAARTLFLGAVRSNDRRGHQQPRRCPPATVYRLFAVELGILKALLDTSIAGDDQPLTVQERPDVASVFAEPDEAPRRFRWRLDGDQPADQRRCRVLVGAAGSDPAWQWLSARFNSSAPEGRGNRARPRAQQITRACRKTTRWVFIHTHGPRGLPTPSWTGTGPREVPGVAHHHPHPATDVTSRGHDPWRTQTSASEDSNPQPDMRGTDLRPGDLVHEGRLLAMNGNPTGSSSGLPGAHRRGRGEHSRLGRWRVPTRQSSDA